MDLNFFPPLWLANTLCGWMTGTGINWVLYNHSPSEHIIIAVYVSSLLLHTMHFCILYHVIKLHSYTGTKYTMQTAEKSVKCVCTVQKLWWWCGKDMKLTLSNNILHNFNGLVKFSGLHLDWVGSHFQLLNYQTKIKLLWVWLVEPSPVLNTAFLFYVRKICKTEL